MVAPPSLAGRPPSPRTHLDSHHFFTEFWTPLFLEQIVPAAAERTQATSEMRDSVIFDIAERYRHRPRSGNQRLKSMTTTYCAGTQSVRLDLASGRLHGLLKKLFPFGARHDIGNRITNPSMQTTSPKQCASFRALDADKILATAQALHSRIDQRFQKSGLSRASDALAAIASESKERSSRLARPIHWVRAVAIVLGALLATVFFMTLRAGFLRFREVASSLSDLAQGIDAGVNEAILLSAAIYFLVTLERRLKRRRALKALHELRSLAHIIDMHQLTKDPEMFFKEWVPTVDSPKRAKHTPFLLERYLDYCSEMLAVLSKLAALYVQNFQDETVLRAVDEVENLTSGLSQKIWQKISILSIVRERKS